MTYKVDIIMMLFFRKNGLGEDEKDTWVSI